MNMKNLMRAGMLTYPQGWFSVATLRATLPCAMTEELIEMMKIFPKDPAAPVSRPEFFMRTKRVSIFEIHVSPPKYIEDAVRVYRDSPETITVQLRAYGPTAKSRTGKAHNMIASAHLTRHEITQLRDELSALLEDHHMVEG